MKDYQKPEVELISFSTEEITDSQYIESTGNDNSGSGFPSA